MWPFKKARKRPEPTVTKMTKAGRPTKEQAAIKRQERIREKEAELKLAELDRKLDKIQKTGQSDEELSFDINKLGQLSKQLRPLGLQISPIRGRKDGDGDEGVAGKVLEAIAALPEILPLLSNLAKGTGLATGDKGLSEREQPRPQELEQIREQQKLPMTDGEKFVAVLGNKFPEQAAQELIKVAQSNASVRVLIDRMCACDSTSDLLEYLDKSLAVEAPTMAAFVEYCHTRTEWITATVEALKEYQAANYTEGPGRTGA